MRYQHLLDQLIAAAKEIFGTQLTGIYLHGSLAMGCFHPGISDIDLIVVVEQPISDKHKLEFLTQVVALNRQAPAKGLEISIVRRRDCAPFCYPTPFVLHFSPMHLSGFLQDPYGYVNRMHGVDKDLAAHITMLHQYGMALYGEPISSVFAEVPREAYIDSIWHDIQHAVSDISDSPVYMILNLCRVLAFLREGLYLSKQSGGAWGLEHLPENCRSLVAEALTHYEGGQDMPVDQNRARQFAARLLGLIRQALPAGFHPVA